MHAVTWAPFHLEVISRKEEHVSFIIHPSNNQIQNIHKPTVFVKSSAYSGEQ